MSGHGSEVPATPSVGAAVREIADGVTHAFVLLALMLPLASPSFGRAAQAVRQGFMAAAGATGKTTTPVRVYTVNEDSLNVLTVYEEAIESGAQVVVGPLTRNGVTALAASTLVKVPTLAQNTPDNRTTVSARLYLFGLGVEQARGEGARHGGGGADASKEGSDGAAHAGILVEEHSHEVATFQNAVGLEKTLATRNFIHQPLAAVPVAQAGKHIRVDLLAKAQVLRLCMQVDQ